MDNTTWISLVKMISMWHFPQIFPRPFQHSTLGTAHMKMTVKWGGYLSKTAAMLSWRTGNHGAEQLDSVWHGVRIEIGLKNCLLNYMTGAKNKRVRKFALRFSGASLVSIRNEGEQKFIENNIMLLESHEDFWIGLFQTQKGNASNIYLHKRISSVQHYSGGPESLITRPHVVPNP